MDANGHYRSRTVAPKPLLGVIASSSTVDMRCSSQGGIEGVKGQGLGFGSYPEFVWDSLSTFPDHAPVVLQKV
jgi:hypothetical protein